MKSLTWKTKNQGNYQVSRRFGKYSFYVNYIEQISIESVSFLVKRTKAKPNQEINFYTWDCNSETVQGTFELLVFAKTMSLHSSFNCVKRVCGHPWNDSSNSTSHQNCRMIGFSKWNLWFQSDPDLLQKLRQWDAGKTKVLF